MIQDPEFDGLLGAAMAHAHDGWDFSYIRDRMVEAPLSWNYAELAAARLTGARSSIDLCTGGGELLSDLAPLPPQMVATESFKPNVEIARKRLSPLGVEVVEVTSHERLPFPDNEFDLVLNRHGAYSAVDLARVLATDGVFLTQQVGSENLLALNRALGANTMPDLWTLEVACDDLAKNGFRIIRCHEQKTVTRFTDIGAIVFYLKLVAWQIPGFSALEAGSELRDLHRHIKAQGSFEASAHRFFIEAVAS